MPLRDSFFLNWVSWAIAYSGPYAIDSSSRVISMWAVPCFYGFLRSRFGDGSRDVLPHPLFQRIPWRDVCVAHCFYFGAIRTQASLSLHLPTHARSPWILPCRQRRAVWANERRHELQTRTPKVPNVFSKVFVGKNCPGTLVEDARHIHDSLESSHQRLASNRRRLNIDCKLAHQKYQTFAA